MMSEYRQIAREAVIKYNQDRLNFRSLRDFYGFFKMISIFRETWITAANSATSSTAM